MFFFLTAWASSVLFIELFICLGPAKKYIVSTLLLVISFILSANFSLSVK